MLWVRSQDKEALLGVSSVWVEVVNRFGVGSSKVMEYRLQAKRSHETGWSLGVFSTKARALEELNRIHDWIALQNARGVYQVSQEDQ